jgi:hypothetical protein
MAVSARIPQYYRSGGFSRLQHDPSRAIGVIWTRDGKREREEYGHGSFELSLHRRSLCYRRAGHLYDPRAVKIFSMPAAQIAQIAQMA